MTDEKSIVVVMDAKTNRPQYQFNGHWIGRDVKIVSNKMFKEYRHHMTTVFRQLKAETQKGSNENDGKPERPDESGTAKRRGRPKSRN